MTPLNDTTTARITISNPKLSRLSSPVIRGAILPQGPKAFEFLVPEGVPLSISPRVGTLGLDKVSKQRCYLTLLASFFLPSHLSLKHASLNNFPFLSHPFTSLPLPSHRVSPFTSLPLPSHRVSPLSSPTHLTSLSRPSEKKL